MAIEVAVEVQPAASAAAPKAAAGAADGKEARRAVEGLAKVSWDLVARGGAVMVAGRLAAVVKAAGADLALVRETIEEGSMASAVAWVVAWRAKYVVAMAVASLGMTVADRGAELAALVVLQLAVDLAKAMAEDWRLTKVGMLAREVVPLAEVMRAVETALVAVWMEASRVTRTEVVVQVQVVKVMEWWEGEMVPAA